MIRLSKIITVLLLSAFFLGCTAQKQENVERKQLFDFGWKFKLGDYPGATAIDFNDSDWKSIDLPYDWSIGGKIEKENPTGGAGGYFPAGIGWYRKTFQVPDSWKGKKVLIYFGGVYMNTEVFINGKSLGVHPYGYTSFDYDISSYLNLRKENVISVRVDNSQQQNCRWYSGSGIYRHVWLIVTNPVHLAHWGTYITSSVGSNNMATVEINTVLKNETGSKQSVVLSTQITGKDAGSVGQSENTVELKPHDEKTVSQLISVKNPSLWTPETPNLYQAHMILTRGEKTIDIVKKTFGIRTIEFSAENGFQLNGKTVKLNGGCVHHDNGCLGANAYDRAEIRRVRLLKQAGFNAVRTSHNPPSEAFLNACDSLGLLVIDEAFDGWRESKTPYDYARYFDKWWKRDLSSMVLRDRNHPSVIMWSVGNEIIERTKPEAVKTAKMMVDRVHQLDTTRPVTSAMTTWNQGWKIFDPLMAVQDVCGYNYQLQRAPSDHERVPSRIIVQTESYPKDAFYCWDMDQNHSYIIGDFVWTAMDYLGESGIGRYYYPGDPKGESWETNLFPWHGSYCGDIDLTGWRKPISHYRNILWNDTEKLYMAVREPNPDNGKITLTSWAVWPTWESWTWPGREGKDIQVEVYSKYPSVRLYLDNKLIGEKPTTQAKEFKATFTLPYTPGELKAVGVVDNQEVESTILKTAGKPAQIKLAADRDSILANGEDLSFVTIEMADKKGVIQPNADNLLKFSVDGPGGIAGVANANLQDTTSYAGNERRAWKGRALVVIKSTHQPGTVKLTVSSAGMPDATINIKTMKR